MRMLLERYYEVPVSAGFDKLGFSPNGVTILGLIVTLISAIFISLGMFLVGGIVIGFAALVLLRFYRRIAGFSGIFGGLLPFDAGETLWRLVFLAGLITGGVILSFLH